MPKVSLYRNRVPLKLGHKHSQGRYSRLEPDEGKLSRPVLRGGGESNLASLTRRWAAFMGANDMQHQALTLEADLDRI
jgi:hypothetical protein